MFKPAVMPSNYVDPTDAKLFELCTKHFKPLHEMHTLHEVEAGRYLKCLKWNKVSVNTIRKMVKKSKNDNVYDFFMNQLEVTPLSDSFNLDEKYPELKTKRSNGAPMREPLQTRVNDYIECYKNSMDSTMHAIWNDPLNVDIKKAARATKEMMIKGCMKLMAKNNMYELMYMQDLSESNPKLFGEFGRKMNVIIRIMRSRFGGKKSAKTSAKPYVPTGEDDFWGYSKPKDTKPEVMKLLDETPEVEEVETPEIEGMVSPLKKSDKFVKSVVSKKSSKSSYVPEDVVDLPTDASERELEYETQTESVVPTVNTTVDKIVSKNKNMIFMAVGAMFALLVMAIVLVLTRK